MEACVPNGEKQYSTVISNREQRFRIMRESPEDYINLLVDADTLFSETIKELLTIVGSNSSDEPTLWGVIEYEEADGAHLYFKRTDEVGIVQDLSPDDKTKSYEVIFGANWDLLMSSPQPNNGFLVFQNCASLADTWRDFYRRGLHVRWVNPHDDQVPLAAAITSTKTRLVRLDEKFNSKGAVNGTFAVFHAFAGLWRSEFRAALCPSLNVSDFANMARPFLQRIPLAILDSYRLGPGQPYEYLSFPGSFSFDAIYCEIVGRIPSGKVVEIGTHRRKSTCFLAELIRASIKTITFVSIDIYKRVGSYEELTAAFREKELLQYVSLLNMQSNAASTLFEDKSLDMVFIDRRHDYPALSEDLEKWFPKVRDGGILAGDDYTTSHKAERGVRKAVDEFAAAHSLHIQVKPPCFIFQL